MSFINQMYGNSARFDVKRFLSEDELRGLAPSIFALDKHESRSDRFEPIPTIEVLRGLMKEGFMPVGAKQCRTRTPGKAAHTKHLIRLRRLDDDRQFKVNDTLCELTLKNANDGTSAYALDAGLYRIDCMNSLVSQIATLDSVTVRHSGDVQAKVIEGTYEVLETSRKCLAAPDSWSGLTMSRDESLILAETALAIRFGEEGNAAQAIKPADMLRPRREADRGADLWTQFNVVQEHAIRGGLRGFTRDAQNRRRHVTTRAVNGIDQDLKLNKALWVMAQRMAELKGGAVI